MVRVPSRKSCRGLIHFGLTGRTVSSFDFESHDSRTRSSDCSVPGTPTSSPELCRGTGPLPSTGPEGQSSRGVGGHVRTYPHTQCPGTRSLLYPIYTGPSVSTVDTRTRPVDGGRRRPVCRRLVSSTGSRPHSSFDVCVSRCGGSDVGTPVGRRVTGPLVLLGRGNLTVLVPFPNFSGSVCRVPCLRVRGRNCQGWGDPRDLPGKTRS